MPRGAVGIPSLSVRMPVSAIAITTPASRGNSHGENYLELALVADILLLHTRYSSTIRRRTIYLVGDFFGFEARDRCFYVALVLLTVSCLISTSHVAVVSAR